ncbi:MAG: type II toxin-antitoxin system VapC family toxin [Chitinophagales bacterium]
MDKVLLDSNIIIYATRNKALRNKLSSFRLLVSEISRLEVFGYFNLEPDEELALELFFKNISPVNISTAVINEAILIRKGKSISTADAIIAASAKNFNIPLYTHNTKDFKHIKDIVVIDPLQK